MALTLDLITIGAPDVQDGAAFYAAALPFDRNGSGGLAVRDIQALAADVGADPATRGFRGWALSAIVEEPRDVRALLDAAVAQRATVLKPAKRKLFGEYAATYRAPDGAVWKLAAVSKKDRESKARLPKAVETALYLGVPEPSRTKVFYEALGMTADHDYGDKFVDFAITDEQCRLGLLPRNGLAKDVGVDEDGDGFSAVILGHVAATRGDVDALLTAARAAGGTVTREPAPDPDGGYTGRFTDPDGTHWVVGTPA
jgi:uncharacterized protein